MKKNFLLAAFTLGATSLASTLLSAPVRAQTFVNVPINVVVPDTIYIQTYKSLTFKPSSTEFLGIPQNIDGNFTSDGNVDQLLPDPASITTTKGIIKTNDILVYRIWGTGGAGSKIEHSVTYTGNTLYKDGDTSSPNTIGISVASPAGAIQSEAPGLDPANPVKPIIEGNVQFQFDFSSANASGTYSAPPGEALKITATGI
ncbi:hypothetical protein [Nostoc sp. FACHB-280]|uniref:hypothetical protein n=1 Tax=Nostoc sp. FACHB-280 TaxID=2692839 RepID=UPI00168B724B|nr:hypothetical protein [Nostoc sp. FACHB-280]MBD2495532.1 hypothetical protein [Nostoc sp. FACHB-280]